MRDVLRGVYLSPASREAHASAGEGDLGAHSRGRADGLCEGPGGAGAAGGAHLLSGAARYLAVPHRARALAG